MPFQAYCFDMRHCSQYFIAATEKKAFRNRKSSCHKILSNFLDDNF